MTQDANDLTRLIATKETLAVLSDLPISIHTFGSVSPWLLCIGRAQASLRGNCCLSWKPISICDVTVIGHIGIHNDWFTLKTGPL